MTSNLAFQPVLFTIQQIAICFVCVCRLSNIFSHICHMSLSVGKGSKLSLQFASSSSFSFSFYLSLPIINFTITTTHYISSIHAMCILCAYNTHRRSNWNWIPPEWDSDPLSLIAIHQHSMLLNIFTSGQLVTPDSDKHLGQH